jgi:hypothetical protein
LDQIRQINPTFGMGRDVKWAFRTP